MELERRDDSEYCVWRLFVYLSNGFYACIFTKKFSQLYTKNNPNISGATILDYTDKINLLDADFAMPVSLESFYKSERKEDQRYVRMFAHKYFEF